MATESQSQTIRKDSQYSRMVEGPISKVILSLAIPSVLSMLVSSIYNMADTYFVGKLGTSASGAVGIVFPIMLIIQAVAFTFGQGANSLISRYLGAKDTAMAHRTASTAIFSCMIVSVFFSVVTLIFLDPILRILGSTETILPYAHDYAFIILLGSPFIGASFVLNNLLRSQGLNAKAMIGLTFGGVLNIILDPIFILALDMGIAGAALATIISQFVSFLILLWMVEKRSVLLLRPRLIARQVQLYLSIAAIGMPSFLRQALGSVAIMILNNRASDFGDPAVAAFTIIGRIASFFLAFILGTGQAFQPVAGYNFGAKQYGRVREAYRFTLRSTLILMSIVSLAVFLLSENLISVFQPDPAVVAIGTLSLRLQCATFILQPFLVVTNMLYQSTGKAGGALVLATMRHGTFYYPVVFLFPALWGLLGVQLVQPVADILSCLAAIPMGIIYLKKLRVLENRTEDPERGTLQAVQVLAGEE